MQRLSRYAKATARFMLLVGSAVCFTLALTGMRPLGEDGGSIGWLGALFLTLTALFLDPENPPNA